MKTKKWHISAPLLAMLCAIFFVVPSASAESMLVKDHRLSNSCMITVGYSWGDHVGTAYTSEVSRCSKVNAKLEYISNGTVINSLTKKGDSWADVSVTGVTGVVKSVHGGANVNEDFLYYYLYKK